MIFGEYFKHKRIARGLTLREFCREYGYDPGNISKLERGRVSAPRSVATLNGYAAGLKLTGADKEQFMTLAAISARVIPDALTKQEFVAKLPLLLDIGKASKEDLEKFAEWLRDRM